MNVKGTIQVSYGGLIWLASDRSPEETASLDEPVTLASLLRSLCERHGAAFAEKIFQDDGTLQSGVWVIHNGCRLLTPLLTYSLQNGDRVFITSPLLPGG